MGVLTLRSHTLKKYKKHVSYHTEHEKIHGHFDILGIDSNPKLYAAAYRAFEFGPCKSFFPQNEHLTYDEKEKLMMKIAWKEIMSIANRVSFDTLMIAFDGVAPNPKLLQQRQRRYKREMANDGEFDLCKLSTGTDFMRRFDIFVRHQIHLTNWGKRKVIYSSHNVPGEGEHKIMDEFRRYPKNSNVCMYGPDGDLIMLGLASKHRFTLFNVTHHSEYKIPQYYTIRCHGIRKQMKDCMSFVYLGFMLGNDFVPRLELFHLFADGIDDLMSHVKGKVVQNGRLNKNILLNILKSLKKTEKDMIVKRKDHHPFPLLEKHVNGNKLDFVSFRNEYYERWVFEKSYDDENIKVMCHEYLDTLLWTWKYYIEGCPSFDHMYHYHYPPFVCDLVKYFDDWKPKQFVSSVPKTPFEQLCLIMPKNRAYLLPQEYEKVFENMMNPEDVKTNVEGRNPQYEPIVEVPIDMNIPFVKQKRRYGRNGVIQQRVFRMGDIEYFYETMYGKIKTYVSG